MIDRDAIEDFLAEGDKRVHSKKEPHPSKKTPRTTQTPKLMHKYLNPFTGVFEGYWSSFWNTQYKAILFLHPIIWFITHIYTNHMPYPAIFVWAYTITLINTYIYLETKGR